MECFQVPVRFYSTYLESIAAPAGFETPTVPLDTNKWQHLPPHYPIKLKIRLENNSSYSIEVGWNERVLDKIKINLGDSRRLVQFTVKSPSISCKYIIWQGASPFMKRFQITLNGDEDFAKLCTILKELRLVVKPARGVVPQENQPLGIKMRQEFQAGTSGTLNFGSRESQVISAATRNTNVSLTGKPLLDKKYFSQTDDLRSNFLLASQAPAAPFANSLPVLPPDSAVVLNSASRNESISSFLNDSLLQAACDSSIVSTTKPPIVYQQEQIRCEAFARTPLHEEVEVTLKDVQQDSRQATILQHEVSNAATEQILQPKKSSPSHQNLNKNREGKKQGHDSVAEGEPKNSLFPKVLDHEDVSSLRESVICNSNVNNVLLSMEEVQGNKSLKNNKKTINKQKNQTKADKVTIPDPITSIETSPPVKIRLSKRIIKEKLKDENLMRWVSKVEETLREMVS